MTPTRPTRPIPTDSVADPLATFSTRPEIAGIYRIDDQELPALKAAASDLGQAVFTVDLRHARNVPGFLKAMKRDLRFPDGFGNNLDALNDCLTDFSWHPAAGYVIILAHSEALQANPSSLATLNEVLAFAAESWKNRDIPFRIFYLHGQP